MLESPAYRVLSLSARRILDRIEIEYAHHGGNDNGLLVVTYENFQRYGVDRHCIRPALNELEALGFVKIAEPAFVPSRDLRLPNKFGLTYRAWHDGTPATNEWKSVKTDQQASQAVRMARGSLRTRKRYERKTLPMLNSKWRLENRFPVWVFPSHGGGFYQNKGGT